MSKTKRTGTVVLDWPVAYVWPTSFPKGSTSR